MKKQNHHDGARQSLVLQPASRTKNDAASRTNDDANSTESFGTKKNKSDALAQLAANQKSAMAIAKSSQLQIK